MSKTGDRVGAICSMQDGVISLYGEGTYIGQRVPSTGEFREMGITNPCIKLDSGDYVWGYQCWWGDIAQMKDEYGEAWDKAKVVTTPSIPPLPEGHEN